MPLPSGGQHFIDSYWYFGESKAVYQRPEHSKNNCYCTIQCSLGYKPSECGIEKVFKATTIKFKGTKGALKISLAMQAVAAQGGQQPDRIIVPVDDGGAGKTVFSQNLSKAVFGDGTCLSIMLQLPEEWRKQARNFVGCLWKPIDECKPGIGVEEEIMNTCLCGLSLPCRKNHEAETHYASWPSAGRRWCMNSRDIPYIPGASDERWARGLRCIRSRIKLVTDLRRVSGKTMYTLPTHP